jgi:Soluble lytic murein transglycosylase and related regulatory proteins (some contain LysM/invasin domains)
MKKIILTLLIFSCVGCFAQVETDYEKYVREQNEQMQKMQKSQDEAIVKMQKEYEAYVKAEKEAYDHFVKTGELLWGKGNVKESTQKDWVEYSADGKTRSTVDFESGEATIEIIQEKGKAVDNKEIEKKLKFLLTNKGKTKDYDSEVEKAVPLQEKPVLENQVKTPSGEVVTEEHIDEDVKEIAAKVKPEVKTIKGEDNVERQVVTIKLELAPDHIRTRAEQYKNEIQKYCQKWDVNPALAYAIMQTESSFNPKAKSYVPAYGLMQIVPKTAGADCAQSLKKPFSAPTGNYLYEPENNIEMGVHYLYLLKKRYFTNVNDKDSQNLCVIASYNTGAGNLARALRGDTKIGKAIPQINEMTYDQLFKYLEKKLLPETQNYIRRVTERMNNFKTWLK